jgi:hypothetical protein
MNKAEKRAEEAEDRERMARIVKRYQKPAKKEPAGKSLTNPLRRWPKKLLSIDRSLLQGQALLANSTKSFAELRSQEKTASVLARFRFGVCQFIHAVC